MVLALVMLGGGSVAQAAPWPSPSGARAALLGSAATSAGEDESYVPTGKIIADNGFRPLVDGFSFENYGNEYKPLNMTPFEVEDVFGNQVCVRGTGATCRLSPLAEKWRKAQNEAMGGGHCMGMAVTSLRMFYGTVDPKIYGAARTYDLVLRRNANLQALIAEGHTFQEYTSILKGTVASTPRAVLRKLESDLRTKKEYPTLGIYQRDGNGGHAITPFAVEDQGNGQKKILVYDNNFPGIVRTVSVNTTRNTWRYIGGTNPKDLDELYEGDARTQSLEVTPTTPGEKFQPCPFCSGRASSGTKKTRRVGSVLSKDDQYNEIRLTTVRRNHPHLVLEDAQGRRTGLVNGELVREIPGVRIKRNLAVQNWKESPEPVFQAPVGLPLTVHVDGSQLTKAVNTGITITGPGLDLEIDAIRLAADQQDTVTFPGDAAGLTYETDARASTSPEFYATIEDGDVKKGGAFYVVGTGAIGFGAGSRVGFRINRKAGTFTLDTTGTKPTPQSDGLHGKSLYFATLVRANAKEDAVWVTAPIPLAGGANGERLKINYRRAPAKSKPLPVVTGRPGGQQTTQLARPVK
ncbi:MAG: hypothetical protein JWP18_1094 [Solirubrobacterales bacterium]|nr:hypothetical protein [Solirubrobacterales bacterium]